MMSPWNKIVSFIAVAVVLLLLSCAKPNVMLDRVVVLNSTESKISNVKVLHLPTHKTGGVNSILPQNTFDLGLSGQPMLADKAVISWRDGAGQDWEVTLDLPYAQEEAKGGRLMQLIYVIQPFGKVAAHLKAVNL